MFNLFKSVLRMLLKAYLLLLHSTRVMVLKLNGAQVGDKTWIIANLIKQGGLKLNKLKIGNRCVLCDDSIFLCGEGYKLFLKRDKDIKRENDEINIKDNCFIGIGAIIMNGVSIGPNAIVGAGAVVVDDVKPNTCVAGNPGRFVCDLDSYAKASESGLIEGYSELARMAVSKSEFLVNHFWKEN